MSRSDDLAEEADRAHASLLDVLVGLTPEQWRTPAVNSPDFTLGEDERRPIGVIAHHVGQFLPVAVERARLVTRGEAPAPIDFDAVNANHAAANPDPDQQDTIAMLLANAADAATMIRGLTDADLDRVTNVRGREWTAEQFIRLVLIGHATGHEGSIRATLVR